MKAKRKKIAALLMFVMALGIVMTVNVFASDKEIRINITGLENINSLRPATFEAYKIFDVVYVDTDGSYIYSLVEEFSDFDVYPTYEDETLRQYIGSLGSNSPELFRLAVDLKEFIDENGIDSHATATGTKTVVIDGLDAGFYLVYGIGLTADGEEVVSAPILVSTNNNIVDVTFKGDSPTVNKKVWNQHYSGWDNYTVVNIGDTVRFRLTSAVPDTRGYIDYQYIVWDNMSPGFTLIPAYPSYSGLTVRIGGITLVNDEDYFVDVEIDEEEYTILGVTFDEGLLLDGGRFSKGDEIVIEYSALLNQYAITGDEGNSNYVWIVYSNDPFDEDSIEETHTASVTVYTGTFNFLKYSVYNGDKIYLEGAEFQLFRERASANHPAGIVHLIELFEGDDEEPAIYRVATRAEVSLQSTIGLTDTIITPESGHVLIDGLGSCVRGSSDNGYSGFGEYYLIETEPPEGYIASGEPRKFRFIFEQDYEEWIVYDYDEDEYIEFPYMMEIYNDDGDLFPETGGIGRLLIYALGAALTISSISLMVVRKRMNLQFKDGEAIEKLLYYNSPRNYVNSRPFITHISNC